MITYVYRSAGRDDLAVVIALSWSRCPVVYRRETGQVWTLSEWSSLKGVSYFHAKIGAEQLSLPLLY